MPRDNSYKPLPNLPSQLRQRLPEELWYRVQQLSNDVGTESVPARPTIMNDPWFRALHEAHSHSRHRFPGRLQERLPDSIWGRVNRYLGSSRSNFLRHVQHIPPNEENPEWGVYRRYHPTENYWSFNRPREISFHQHYLLDHINPEWEYEDYDEKATQTE